MDQPNEAAVATLELEGVRLDVSLEMIGPAKAALYLKANKRNRSPARSHVAKLVDAVQREEWCVNGETIVFDSEGALVDGQHRLQMIINSSMTLMFLVVRGVEPIRAQDTTGTNRRRTLASQFEMHGEKNPSALGSALGTLNVMLTTGKPSNSSINYPTVLQGMKLLEEHPEIRRSVSKVGVPAARRPPSGLSYPAGLAATLHYLFCEVSAGDADMFWETVRTGENLGPRDARKLLHDRMVGEAGKVAGGGKMNHMYRAALTIKAWNCWRFGEELGTLRWVPSGVNAEAFPDWRATLDEVEAQG